MTRNQSKSGVTLIEVMVAMAILALISTLLFTGYRETAHNKKTVEDEMARYHEIRTGLERMARELSMAFVSAQDNPSPALVVVKTAFVGKEEGAGSRIDFTSFSHQRLYRDAHESDQNELGYYTRNDPDDSSKHVLVRREQNRIDDDPLEGGSAEILIEDVDKLELSFLDPLSGEWLASWDTTQGTMQPNRLPSQVSISVTVPNVRGTGPEQKFTTRASLPLQFALNHATYRK
jgi:general secretion pathway protein J